MPVVSKSEVASPKYSSLSRESPRKKFWSESAGSGDSAELQSQRSQPSQRSRQSPRHLGRSQTERMSLRLPA